MSELILASSSPFRRELLERLCLPFQCISPDIDEAPQVNESLQDQVTRLASSKARKIAGGNATALIIGSDQLASCDGEIFSKPGNHQRAREQLRKMAGRTLIFKTGLCLLNAKTGQEQLDCVDYRVNFRNFSENEIQRYLLAEKPYNCAGSFKSEKLGICLVESMEGHDPSALVGLPLIRLTAMLRQEGVDLP
ncbi:MAG: septum formation inhibitor Maf [Gammaproteobacteria bacterium]|nr:septum formation inhibitor Maf [Gammaproteobacteria bacterium]